MKNSTYYNYLYPDIARRKSSTDHLEDHLDEEEDMEAEEEEEEEEEEDDEGGWKEVKEHTKKKEKPKVSVRAPRISFLSKEGIG